MFSPRIWVNETCDRIQQPRTFPANMSLPRSDWIDEIRCCLVLLFKVSRCEKESAIPVAHHCTLKCVVPNEAVRRRRGRPPHRLVSISQSKICMKKAKLKELTPKHCRSTAYQTECLFCLPPRCEYSVRPPSNLFQKQANSTVAHSWTEVEAQSHSDSEWKSTYVEGFFCVFLFCSYSFLVQHGNVFHFNLKRERRTSLS